MPPVASITVPLDLGTMIGRIVGKPGMKKFFKQDGENKNFVDLVEEEIIKHMNNKDIPPVLKEPDNVERLANLALYHPIFYCDDSLSMENKAYLEEANSPTRFDIQKNLVSRMAAIATMVAPDGCNVDLHFINSGDAVRQNLSQGALRDILTSIKPRGDTKLGTVLSKDILDPFVYDKIGSDHPSLSQPLLICIITDGLPTDSRSKRLGKMITECKEELVDKGYEPTAVMFCISQIGDDPDAKKFLDELQEDDSISDVLHRTSDRLDEKYKELRNNHDQLDAWLLKILSEPIMMKKEDE